MILITILPSKCIILMKYMSHFFRYKSPLVVFVKTSRDPGPGGWSFDDGILGQNFMTLDMLDDYDPTIDIWRASSHTYTNETSFSVLGNKKKKKQCGQSFTGQLKSIVKYMF